MKGIIYYYSGSGNTRLACKYIVAKLGLPFDLIDIVKKKDINLQPYDIVGFATFTDFWGIPYLFQSFIESLSTPQGKLAFVFNTYGFLSAATLRNLRKKVAERGFKVIAGYSLHTPESYPPMIAGGRGYENSPNEKELQKFNEFISEFGEMLGQFEAGKDIGPPKVQIGMLNRILPSFSRTAARKDMGEKFVDTSLCAACGSCEKGCPYGAIHLDPLPVFDMTKCYGCWRCYNRCPNKAIYTQKFRGKPHYPKPIEPLKKKLNVSIDQNRM